MENVLINWLLDLIKQFAQFGSWLTEPLPYINLAPLSILGFTGLTIVIGFLIVRLVVGG